MNLFRPRFRGACLISFLLVGVGSIANAQTGEIKLTVKDPSKSPLRANGKLENLASGVARSFQTDVNGEADLTSVAPARYRLEITHSGFAVWSEAITVGAGAPVSRDITLSLTASSYQMDVVEASPLAGFDVPVAQVPAPVQSVTTEDIQQSGSLDLADFLNKRLAGVNVNESQENPYQPDVNYRGYTASPLLGTPQGISVYFDGVRLNQPFGDVVSWDLIPKIAISEATLMPGSNPLFGLNTLGGAIAITTKDGNSSPGTMLTATGGSYNPASIRIRTRRTNGAFNWYLAGNAFHDDGWRPLSPSDVHQVFSGRLAGRKDIDRARCGLRVQRSLGTWSTGSANDERAGIFERIHPVRRDVQPVAVFQCDAAAHRGHAPHIVRQRLLPQHQFVHLQHGFQFRFARGIDVSTVGRGSGGTQGRGLHRISNQRRQRVEYSISVLAVHSAGAAELRKQRKNAMPF